jgi:hypothetical protein
VIEPPHHRSPPPNRMTATESLFFGTINDFCNKIGHNQSLAKPFNDRVSKTRNCLVAPSTCLGPAHLRSPRS